MGAVDLLNPEAWGRLGPGQPEGGKILRKGVPASPSGWRIISSRGNSRATRFQDLRFCARNVVFAPLILLDYLAQPASTVHLSTVAKPIRSLLVAPFQPRLIVLRAHGCACQRLDFRVGSQYSAICAVEASDNAVRQNITPRCRRPPRATPRQRHGGKLVMFFDEVSVWEGGRPKLDIICGSQCPILLHRCAQYHPKVRSRFFQRCCN